MRAQQYVEFLAHKGSPVENLFAGQSAFLGVDTKVEIGDLIYAIYKWGVLPVFSSPSGEAAVVAGSSKIVSSADDVSSLCYCPSPWKPKGWWMQYCRKNPGDPRCKTFWKWFCRRFPKHPFCNDR